MKKVLSFLICIIITISLATACTVVFATGSDNNAVTSSDTQKTSVNEDDFFDGFWGLFRRIFYIRVSFDTDGGSEIKNQYTFRFIGKITKPTDPEKEGHTFAGWDKEIPTKARWKDISVKAKWTVNKYKITFKSNNGTFSDGSTSKEYILEYGKAIKAPSDLTRSGFKFTGWGPRVSDTVKGDAVYDAQWYKNTKYVKTKGYDEFVAETSKLVSKSLKNIDKDAAQADEFYFGRLIVQADNYNGIDFEELEADEVIYGEDGLVVLQFSSSELAENCADFLDSLTKVSYVEADAFVDVPTDVEVEEIPTSDGKNWGKSYINADKYAYYLEQNNFLNNQITVAVIDSGVDSDHECLKGRILPTSTNSITNSNDIEDYNGHGTHVAGIIVDCTENLSNIKIMAIKALDKNGGTMLSVASAINYAANHNVNVINLSIESETSSASKYVEHAILNAKGKGITVVVAAGNGDKSNDNAPIDTKGVCPAYINEAIVVGAITDKGDSAYFSNYGESVDVCAPGWGIYSGTLNGEYTYKYGTSQAAPHISAVAAMFKLSHPDYTPDQIENLIKQYCVDKGVSGRDDYCGEGCPDMYNAIPNCTVTFFTNGGSEIAKKTVKNSSTLVLPKPTKFYTVTLNANGGTVSTTSVTSNCIFEGWYKNSSLTGTKYQANESFVITRNNNFYASWSDGVLGNVVKPTRDYYTFNGWFSASSGGEEYKNGNTISSDKTLYAHWTLNAESDWSDSIPSGATQTNIRTLYRYRTRDQINNTKTVLMYKYGYYACDKCGFHWYGPTNCSTFNKNCSGWIGNGPYIDLFEFSPSDSGWVEATGDHTVYKHSTSKGDYFYTYNQYTQLYSYMGTEYVTVNSGTSWGEWKAWSSWSTSNPGSASSSKEVQTKTQYKYRYK